jgi:hypothetical protein
LQEGPEVGCAECREFPSLASRALRKASKPVRDALKRATLWWGRNGDLTEVLTAEQNVSAIAASVPLVKRRFRPRSLAATCHGVADAGDATSPPVCRSAESRSIVIEKNEQHAAPEQIARVAAGAG